jgi:hypothetical protein
VLVVREAELSPTRRQVVFGYGVTQPGSLADPQGRHCAFPTRSRNGFASVVFPWASVRPGSWLGDRLKKDKRSLK